MKARLLGLSWASAMVVAFTASTVFPQQRPFPNPPYLAAFPSANRVLEAMKVRDPQETYLRQMGAFYELSEIIKELSGRREYRGYLPDEKKLLDEYSTAQYKVGQAADKAFPGKHLSADLRYHYARWDPRFGFEGIPLWQTFFPHGDVQTRFAQLVGADNKQYAAQIEREKRTVFQVRLGSSQAGDEDYSHSNAVTRGTAARCLELGGSELSCLGKGIGAGFMDMIGINLNSLTGPKPAGLVLYGTYPSRNSKMDFNFSPTSVSMSGCGTLAPSSFAYTIAKKPNQLLVTVQNQPKPFVLVMGKEGGLTGPGTTVVNGRIIVGYHHYWGHKVYSDGTMVPGSAYSYRVPDYAPKTESCSIEEFSSPPPPRVAPAPAGDSGEMLQMMGALLTGFSDVGGPPDQPGLRMAGQYSDRGGLRLDFDPSSVILDCSRAHVRAQYTVTNQPNQILITVKNGSAPFRLVLEPNGTLLGSGETEVNGRLVTGETNGQINYAPSHAECTVGTFSPKAGAKPTDTVSAVPALGQAAKPLTGLSSVQSSPNLQYNRKYRCGGEHIVVAYCRHDSDRAGYPPTTPQNDYCLVYYPDRPMRGGFTVQRSELRSKIIGKLQACSALPRPSGMTTASAASSANPFASTSAANPTGTAVLAVASGFPATADPIAGKMIFLMKSSIDKFMRGLGARLPSAMTACQAWLALGAACRPASKCTSLVPRIDRNIAAGFTLSANGYGATPSSVPPGTYYVMTMVPAGKATMCWNVEVKLRAGANSVTLDAHNAELIK